MTNRDICKDLRKKEIKRLEEKIETLPPAFKILGQLEIKKLQSSNIYHPHQGTKECLRRKKQINRGILKVG